MVYKQSPSAFDRTQPRSCTPQLLAISAMTETADCERICRNVFKEWRSVVAAMRMQAARRYPGGGESVAPALGYGRSARCGRSCDSS